jgi:hypothetical protein
LAWLASPAIIDARGEVLALAAGAVWWRERNVAR